MERLLTEDVKIKGEVRDYIGCRYCAEDGVGGVEDGGLWCITFDNGV